MKSIKEKSEEYAKIKHTDENLIKIVSWDFEAGANYVIEQISQALQGDLDSHSTFKLKTIKQIVEQLKK